MSATPLKEGDDDEDDDDDRPNMSLRLLYIFVRGFAQPRDVRFCKRSENIQSYEGTTKYNTN